MKIIWKNEKRKLSELKPFKENPRRLTERQKEFLEKSLTKFNLMSVPVINTDGVIVSGHQRVKVLQLLGRGNEMIDVRVPNRKLTQAEIREANLLDNKTSELGEYDLDLLANFDEEELTACGWLSEELDQIFNLNIEEDEFDAEQEYGKIKEPKVKRGDLYQLGEHRLLCGDATKREDVEKLMGGKKADMVYCDPPYNVGYHYWGFRGEKRKYSKKIFNDKKKPEEYQKFIQDCFQNAFDFSKDYSSVYCWHGISSEREVKTGLIEAGWHISQTIIWLKNSIVLSIGQDYHRIYEPCYFGWKKGNKHLINKKTGNKWSELILLDRDDFSDYLDVLWEHREEMKNYQHPTQKPVRLSERALKRHSERGHIVLDLFGGSGSTLIACEQLQRRCFMMEIDEKYCDVIIQRFEQFTRKEAIKLK